MKRFILMVMLLLPFWGYRYYKQQYREKENKEQIQEKKEQSDTKQQETKKEITNEIKVIEEKPIAEIKILYKRYITLQSIYGYDNYKNIVLHPDDEHLIGYGSYSKGEERLKTFLYSLKTGQIVKQFFDINEFHVDIEKRYLVTPIEKDYQHRGSIGMGSVVYLLQESIYFCDLKRDFNFWHFDKNKEIDVNSLSLRSISKNSDMSYLRIGDFSTKASQKNNRSYYLAEKHTIKKYNSEGFEIETINVGEYVRRLIRLSKIGRYLISTENKTLICDEEMKLLGVIEVPEIWRSIRATKDQKYIVYFKSTSAYQIEVYSIDEMKVVGSLSSENSYNSVDISSDGQFIVGAEIHDRIVIWKVELSEEKEINNLYRTRELQEQYK